jgi:hypothetical protein
MPSTVAAVVPGICSDFAAPIKGQDKEAMVIYMVGAVAVTSGERPLTSRVVRCLTALWKTKDGAAASAISDGLVAVLEINPEVFFEGMTTSPSIYREWLDVVPRLSFTWRKAPPCPLNAKRDRVILELKKYLASQSPYKELALEALNKFQTLSCRQIE